MKEIDRPSEKEKEVFKNRCLSILLALDKESESESGNSEKEIRSSRRNSTERGVLPSSNKAV